MNLMFKFFKTPTFRAFFIFVFLFTAIYTFFIQTTFATANTSLDYIYSFQDSQTGGIIEDMDEEPSHLQTDWAIMAFASAGFDPNTVAKTDKSIVDFALQDICKLSAVTDIERKILALEAAKIDSQNINGCNLHQKLTEYINIETGQIGEDVISTIFGVLALSAQNQIIPANSIDYIISAQQENGGWDSGWGTESNITAQAIMALESATYTGEALTKAKEYLKNIQTETGGIKYDTNEWSVESDAFSDAFTLMTIHAMEDQPTAAYWLNNNFSILDDLKNLLNSDGSYNFSSAYGKTTPVWTTAIVEISLNRKYLPIKNDLFLPYIEKITLTPSPITSQTVTASVTTTNTPCDTTTIVTESSQESIFDSKEKTIAKTNWEEKNIDKISENQLSSQPPTEIIKTNNPKLTLKPTNESKQKFQWFDLDWRWIIVIFPVALIFGGLFRFLQNRYIDEK